MNSAPGPLPDDSTVLNIRVAFAACAVLFILAVIACIWMPDPYAGLGPVPFRVIGTGTAAVGGLLTLAGLYFGGLRALAAHVLLLIIITLTGLALNIAAMTWHTLAQAQPLSWGILTAIIGVVVVLADFGLWWCIRKVSGPRL